MIFQSTQLGKIEIWQPFLTLSFSLSHIQWTTKSYRLYLLNILNLFNSYFYSQWPCLFKSFLQCGKQACLSFLWSLGLSCSSLRGHGLNQQDVELLPWPVWLSRLECHLLNQVVVGSIPGQDTYPSCGFNPRLRCMQEGKPIDVSQMDVSLSLSFPLKAIKKSVPGWG